MVSHIHLSCVRSTKYGGVSLSQLSKSSPASVGEAGYSECSVESKLGLMFPLFQMMLSLDIPDMATAIRILISLVEVPSLLKVYPRYLKWCFSRP